MVGFRRGESRDSLWELGVEMVKFTVNGTARTFDGDEDMPLLWYLRDDLRLTGTRFGCGAGLCGACTVHVDGQAVRACQTPVRTLTNLADLAVHLNALGRGRTHRGLEVKRYTHRGTEGTEKAQ